MILSIDQDNFPFYYNILPIINIQHRRVSHNYNTQLSLQVTHNYKH